MNKAVRTWRISRIVFNMGCSVIWLCAIVAAITSQCISQRQRVNFDWNLQNIIDNGNTDFFMLISALLALTALALFIKTKLFKGKTKDLSIVGRNIEADLMSPIIFMTFTFFQGDIYKSVIATLAYIAFYLVILLSIIFNLSMIFCILRNIISHKANN